MKGIWFLEKNKVYNLGFLLFSMGDEKVFDGFGENETKRLFDRQKAFEENQKNLTEELSEEEKKEQKKKKIFEWSILILGFLFVLFLFYRLVLK